MLGRKHLIGSLTVALVLAGTGAAALLLRSDAGPFPSPERIASSGFTAWPVDTPEEARAECADAADWRRDPKRVAEMFASEEMGYPDPTVDDDFESGDENSFRSLINSRQVKGVFLGSVLSMKRYGECWYITDGEGREGGWGIDVITFEGGNKLLVPVACCGTRVEIGWGGWSETLESEEKAVETIIDIPERAKGHPGHYIVTHFDRHGVSEVVGVRTLPPLATSEGADPVTPMDLGRRPDDRRLCRMTWARKDNPHRTNRQMINWTFNGGLDLTEDGYPRFDTRSKRRLGSDLEWQVRLDEADLRFRFSRAADKCVVIREIVPSGPRIIERISVGKNSLTFDLDPGRADKVIVYSGIGGKGASVSIETKRPLGQPFSVSTGPDGPPRYEDLPGFALAITYRNGNMHSAEYRLFETPDLL